MLTLYIRREKCPCPLLAYRISRIASRKYEILFTSNWVGWIKIIGEKLCYLYRYQS